MATETTTTGLELLPKAHRFCCKLCRIFSVSDAPAPPPPPTDFRDVNVATEDDEEADDEEEVFEDEEEEELDEDEEL